MWTPFRKQFSLLFFTFIDFPAKLLQIENDNLGWILPFSSQIWGGSHITSPLPDMCAVLLRNAAALCCSQRLFVHYREQSQGLPLSAQSLCEAVTGISLLWHGPPRRASERTPEGFHSAAFHRGMTVEDIFTVASWSSPSSFSCFYLQDVSCFSMAHFVLSVLSEWLITSLDCYSA